MKTKRKNSQSNDSHSFILLGIMILFLAPYFFAYFYSQALGWGSLNHLAFFLICIPIAVAEIIAMAFLSPFLIKSHHLNEKTPPSRKV
ncbi:MAG: hypothetical protein K0S20_574 [Patescibacteria group bacterium]|jgi:hypothetical protein|nr:hypothetical protein [Patescibacteria group bacterium]